MAEPVPRIFGREQAYWTGITVMLLFNVGLIFFGWALLRVIFPGEQLLGLFTAAEISVYTLAGLSIVGVLLHAANRRPWLARWCFLLSIGAASLSLLALVFGGDISWQGRLGLSLLVATGGVSALSMHVEHGAKRTVYRTKTPPEVSS